MNSHLIAGGDFLQLCKKKSYLLLHPLSVLLVTTLLVVQISISQAFQVVPACLLAQFLPCLPFLTSVPQDPSFLFFRIFQVVPWDLEVLSFPFVPSYLVVPLPQWCREIRGDLRGIPFHLTYST